MDKLTEDSVEMKIGIIESIVDSVVCDFSRIAHLRHKYLNNELVIFNKELPVISISREYSKDTFTVNFFSFVEIDLSNVQVMNLHTVYHDIEILEYLNANDLKLWFYNDKDLIMEYNFVKNYQDIETLSDELLLTISILFFSKLRIRDLLNGKYYELRSVLVN